jgi:hypothetical protein
VPDAEGGVGRADGSAALAAVVSVGLGLLAGVMMVAGHAPWEGREIVSLSQDHGIHIGDALALVPVVAGALLARWCLRSAGRATARTAS